MPAHASGSRPRAKAKPKARTTTTSGGQTFKGDNKHTKTVELDPKIFGLTEDKVTFDYDPNIFEDVPELKAKSERMDMFSVDYDPKSTTYKVDFREGNATGPDQRVDHQEAEAPFAVGFRRSWDIEQAMGMIWGDKNAEYEKLHALFDDLHTRALEQRSQCLELYDKRGALSTSHTKFHDNCQAYLFLSFRASACTHLQQLRYWKSTFELAKGIDCIITFIEMGIRETRGRIGAKVKIARDLLRQGDEHYLDDVISAGEPGAIGQHWRAAMKFSAALATLSCWLAHDWWMLPSEDTQGLSNVEIELHLRLVRCAFDFGLKDLAVLHIGAVLRHGFATNGQIARASMLQIQNLEIKKSGPDFPPSHLDIVNDCIWNAKALAAFASARPAAEKWHVQYSQFSLEEKMRRLRGLEAIMPLLFG